MKNAIILPRARYHPEGKDSQTPRAPKTIRIP